MTKLVIGQTRRHFLQRSAAIAVPALGVWSSRSAAASKGANDKLNIGCVGVGGKGWVDMNGVAAENIVAVCDVDSRSLDKAAAKFKGSKRYSDFRKMLEQKDIDAVTVSTPDHTHAPAAVMAIRLGKHVYCQKPLTHSVYESRVMREAARRHKVATQMGNQGHSLPEQRRMVELVRSGAIGGVRQVHVWTNRPIWPQGVGRPAGGAKPPAHLNWDLWLGPAPERPYNAAYHPFKWRGFWDFGTGALGDMGCHNMDMAFWALKLGAPESITAESSGINKETAPKWSVVHYRFPKRGELPAVDFTWYDGGKKPPEKLVPGHKFGTNGAILIGDKGTIFVPHYWGKGMLLPADRFKSYQDPKPSLPRSPGHYAEWVQACKGGPPALSNFDYSTRLTECVLLGNVALRTGKKIVWDDQAMKAMGVPEADPFLRRKYRKGWTL